MKTIFYLFISILLVSCKVNEKPEYKALENIQIDEMTNKEVVVSADAVYFNPNHIGGTVKKVDIDLFLDGVHISKVTSMPFEINGQENFRIPLKANVPYGDLFGTNGNNMLGSILNATLSNTIQVNYKGSITLDLGAIDYDYALDETLDLKLR